MVAFDASSMIHAWDNYPPDKFPQLWNWIAEQIGSEEVVMSAVAFDEVGHKIPDCHAWLGSVGIKPLPVDNAILLKAIEIKNLLGIINDKYFATGVDENDVFIIATSSVHNIELVSNEARQATPPLEAGKRKIPAVCVLPQVNVPCLNFLDFIKRSGEVFG